VSYSEDGKQLWAGDTVWTGGSWSRSEQSFPGPIEAVSRDHRWGALWSFQPPRLILWDTGAGSAAATVALPGKKNGVHLATFSDDGKTLAISTNQNQWLLYEVPSGKLLHDISEAVNGGASMAFSSDGKMLATAGNGADVHLFDVASGRPTRTCQPTGAIQGIGLVRFTPDGKLLAAEGFGNGIYIIDPNTGETVGTIEVEGHDRINDVVVSRDERYLAVATNGAAGRPLRVFDWKTKQEIFPPTGARSTITQLAYAPGGRQLAAGSVEGEIQLWNTATGNRLLTLSADCSGELQYSSDGWALGAAGREGSYHLWSADSADDLARRSAPQLSRYPYGPLGLALSPELNEIAQGAADGRVEMLATATGAERRAFTAYKDGVVMADRYSPDGRLIATARGDSDLHGQPPEKPSAGRESIQLWDAASGKLVKNLISAMVVDREFRGDPRAGFNEIVFSPDGALLTGVHSSGAAVVWDIANGSPFYEFNPNGPFGFSSAGGMLIRANGYATEAVELASGQVCWRRKSSAAPETSADAEALAQRPRYANPVGISALAIAPDDRTFATAQTDDNSILIWSLAPGDWAARPATAPWTDAELNRLWDALAVVDAPAAYSAMWRLREAGDRAVDMIRQHVGPAHKDADEERRIGRLIADLDSEVYIVREKASDELKELGEAAMAQLRRALAAKPSLEARTRIERLLAELDSPIHRFGGEPLRRIRAIHVVAEIDSKNSTALLEAIAGGDPGARETREAKSALDRRRARANGR